MVAGTDLRFVSYDTLHLEIKLKKWNQKFSSSQCNLKRALFTIALSSFHQEYYASAKLLSLAWSDGL